MINPRSSPLVSPSGTPAQVKPLNSVQPAFDGPVIILWDIENCPVPFNVCPEDVAGNIRTSLRLHPMIHGAVTSFSAYGDFNAFPRRVREGCQRTGVKLIDVPNGRKDAADKAILVDMFLFALDNPPPSSIMLISGDVDFAPALHVLGQRGYNVILAIPSANYVSSALCNAGRFLWDWPSLARGFGPGYVENPEGRIHEEEMGIYRGNLQSYSTDNNDVGTYSSSHGLNEDACGDVNELKMKLVKLLEMGGGCVDLVRIPADYQKLFRRPLFVSDYGVSKLASLLSKMEDSMVIEGRGQRRFVCLRNSRETPPLLLAGRGEDVREYFTDDPSEEDDAAKERLEEFKYELQEVLVSCSCGILLTCFGDIYQQKYKKPLNYERFGVAELEQLLNKFKDVVVLRKEPVSKRRFVAAVGY